MNSFLAYSPELIAEQVVGAKHLMLFGESGIGKSTLASDLARSFAKAGRLCLCIDADPGSPSFGPPGAVCLGRWEKKGWQQIALEALCTLDAGRFRLPLTEAVRHLARMAESGILLVDAPGIVRSVAGAELLKGLVEAAAIDTVLVLAFHFEKLPLANELATLGCRVVLVQPSGKARPPNKKQRARQRTGLWESYLQHGRTRTTITLSVSLLTGTPPPLEAEQDWQGRQIALLRKGRTLAMGEVLGMGGGAGLRVIINEIEETPDQFLVRDCYRNELGFLATFRAADAPGLMPGTPPDVAVFPATEKSSGPRPTVRLRDATAIMVNGVFGDPLLHLRLHNKKRSLLFDLGEGSRLPARLAHQVSDVFISHAHIDHIGGFFWLLRSRMGLLKPLRLFGPPALSDRISSLTNGIHWDRIGENGPRFEIGELHDDCLLVYGLQAGREKKELLDERPAAGGLLLEDADCRVRAVALVHGGIPVIAYQLELAPKLNVIKERLLERRLAAGPWIGELKKRIAAGDRRATILLPDGSSSDAASLADELLMLTPASRLTYATDLSDTEANRQKLTGLAKRAQVFFCEAAFLAADRKYAELSGHLTAEACGEIAHAAEVKRLEPFHFSRRYEERTKQVYDEVRAAFPVLRMR